MHKPTGCPKSTRFVSREMKGSSLEELSRRSGVEIKRYRNQIDGSGQRPRREESLAFILTIVFVLIFILFARAVTLHGTCLVLLDGRCSLELCR